MIKYYLTLFFKTFLVLGVFSQTNTTTYLSDNGLNPREQFVDFIHLKADLKFDVNQKMVFGMVTHQFVPKRFSIDSLIRSLSITTSISCVLYRSKRIPFSISLISPSTRTRKNPCLEICSKSSR